ncbi:hypothetical protein JVU11DRAFT_8425 [Chiua virens]|nr:hypothetical protein JVU11DRAFT_8425 [Chiua virens]
MSDFPPLPAEWVLDTSRDPPVYTRPLVGSELVMHRQWKAFDGCGEVCLGVTFTTTVRIEVLERRARDALDKLRFLCPIIACTIEDGVSSRWVYTTSANRKAWLDLAFAVEDRGASLNAPQFMNSINIKQLPYTDEHGTTSIFRVYLLTTSKRRDDDKLDCGLYFHSSHCILDGGAALNTLTLMCEWMSGKGMEVSVAPSEEWNNLPVDPITATGGPLEEWEVSGVDLVQDVVEQVSRTSTCHSLSPPSRPLNPSDLPFYYAITLSESESAAIVAKTKKLGVSLTALFQAAHCLAQFIMNPISAASTDVDFSV